MSVTPSTTVVGVFRDQSAAEQAVNALYNAGFEHEQIQYMIPGTSGSFLEGLKNFLTGTYMGGENVAGDLTGMGLPDTDAEYYANEYNNGNPILIVRAAERETEAINVLRQYGAYNTQTEAAGDTQQSPSFTQQGSSTADVPPSSDYVRQSGYGAPGQYDNVQELETQPQEHTGEEHSYTAAPPENAAQEYDLSDQDTVIITPANDTYAQDMDTQEQDMQADSLASAPAADRDNSASGTNTAMREQDAETPLSPLPSAAPQEYGMYQDAQLSETVSETDVYGHSTDYSSGGGNYTTTSSSRTVSETDTHDQDVDAPTTADMTGYDSQPQQSMQATPATVSQAPDMQPAQASVASPEQMDELQQLQAQLQMLQQQLQEAKARLAEAKEQENQIKTARERQQQLQSARQQLQDVQAELQATMAEYQETQSRLAQYQ